MRQAHITFTGMNLDYKTASILAAAFADRDEEIIDPVMVAWQDKKSARMSPVIKDCNINTGWHDYAVSHGGKLEVDVNGEYDFIFGDSSAFDTYGPSPFINLHDALYAVEGETVLDVWPVSARGYAEQRASGG